MAAITEEYSKSLGLNVVENNGDGTGSVKVKVDSQTAGETHVGEVGGNANIVKTIPTVSLTIYAPNDVVSTGGVAITGAMRISGGNGILQSILVKDAANQKPVIDILIFDSALAGTYTDNAAFTLDAADVSKLIRKISILSADYQTIGSKAYADVQLNRVVKASGSANLYALIVLQSGTPTFVAATDLQIDFGFSRN